MLSSWSVDFPHAIYLHYDKELESKIIMQTANVMEIHLKYRMKAFRNISLHIPEYSIISLLLHPIKHFWVINFML